MENLQKQMLNTVADNLSHCTDLPEECASFDDFQFDELINYIKTVKRLIRDNVNMIYTIINTTPESEDKINI